MPPGLPVKFQNVHYYRVAGHYVFAGDLFIARNNLYFFPEVDLAQEREEISRVLPQEIALVLVMLMSLAQRVGVYASHTNDLWKTGLSDRKFQTAAATYIEGMRAKRWWRYEEFGKSLPVPTHVRTEEISGMKLTSWGRLSFLAQSDTHDFNVGVFRKKRLQNALWEAGLGRV